MNREISRVEGELGNASRASRRPGKDEINWRLSIGITTVGKTRKAN